MSHYRIRAGFALALAVVASMLAACGSSSPVAGPAAGGAPVTPGTATEALRKQGYIVLADGTKLAYSVALPAVTGRFPVAMAYAGYCEGADPYCNDATNAHALLAAGYAVLGVSIRGTGCSTGTFDVFTAQEALDGAEAVEWAAAQEWSNGHVGLYGDSFPGITQPGIAALHPPHLDAIAPFQVTTDLYRDVGYPGGLLNVLFGAFWSGFDQPFNAYTSGIQQAAGAGDVGCVLALGQDLTDMPFHNVGLTALMHPYDDAYWQARRPGVDAASITVPVFNCLTWQDDEVSSRAFSMLGALDPARTWAVAANGYHAQCEIKAPLVTQELIAFFDHFVKGEANGFEATPHIQIWHEAAVNAAGEDAPGWVTSYDSFAAINPRPLALYLQPDGALGLSPPAGAAAAKSYLYPGPVLGNEEGVVLGQRALLWKTGAPVGASVAYTTPALTSAAEFIGSGSADLWLSSTAPDTDLQITLTEVRPDGQEVYISRGWLRASHRRLDEAGSTALAPRHTHQQADMEMLAAGEPTAMRVQLWPFNHHFRKGSSIRLWIDAPTGVTGGWGFVFNPVPAINSIHADAGHPSALVLGQVAPGRVEAPLPACDTLFNQPCRANRTAVPAGVMAVPGVD